MALKVEFGKNGQYAVVKGSERDMAEYLERVLRLSIDDSALFSELLVHKEEVHKMLFSMLMLRKHKHGQVLVEAVQDIVPIRVGFFLRAIAKMPECESKTLTMEMLKAVLRAVEAPEGVMGTREISKN